MQHVLHGTAAAAAVVHYECSTKMTGWLYGNFNLGSGGCSTFNMFCNARRLQQQQQQCKPAVEKGSVQFVGWPMTSR
jgi:hypothetical protein